MSKYIVYIIIIAIITMALIYIGMQKEKSLDIKLINKLYIKCCNKVMKSFKNKETMSGLEIREVIKDEEASIIWSKKKLKVTNKIQFTNYVIDGLLNLNKIELINEQKRIYRAKK